ncbi:MAG: ISAzo13 family transposase [Streptosporangiaceae bacterium]
MSNVVSAEESIVQRFALLAPSLDERRRRLVVAAEALALGWGGISRVARATGVSRGAIQAGIAELRAPAEDRLPSNRVRKAGGGRKRTVAIDPTLRSDLERLVEPVTRGDPQSPLRWTCKSVRKLAAELGVQGHRVSRQLVMALLHELDYSLQANRKTLEGGDHPDRDAQFAHINTQVQAQLAAGAPAISVDTKKKELVGPFKNGGQEWQPQGQPEAVRVHDFVDPKLGRASPYGVYDLAQNIGWVSVGIDHDTAAFAVESIRRWWDRLGQAAYPHATRLLISADGGGSNGSRVRLWKLELQHLADETGLAIQVCHLPPGTSKWNKIEHRLFAFISQNWRGKPLVSYEVIVSLIAATTTTTGLQVSCELDAKAYPAGRRVSDEELATVRLERDAFHGDWNYTILPAPTTSGGVVP